MSQLSLDQELLADSSGILDAEARVTSQDESSPQRLSGINGNNCIIAGCTRTRNLPFPNENLERDNLQNVNQRNDSNINNAAAGNNDTGSAVRQREQNNNFIRPRIDSNSSSNSNNGNERVNNSFMSIFDGSGLHANALRSFNVSSASMLGPTHNSHANTHSGHASSRTSNYASSYDNLFSNFSSAHTMRIPQNGISMGMSNGGSRTPFTNELSGDGVNVVPPPSAAHQRSMRSHNRSRRRHRAFRGAAGPGGVDVTEGSIASGVDCMRREKQHVARSLRSMNKFLRKTVYTLQRIKALIVQQVQIARSNQAASALVAAAQPMGL